MKDYGFSSREGERGRERDERRGDMGGERREDPLLRSVNVGKSVASPSFSR